MSEGMPSRKFMDDPNITWRYAKPDFSKVDALYMEGRTRAHPAGSLQKTVENLVKTFEMEATHKTDPRDWGSVDPEKFRLRINGGNVFTLSDVIERGSYNVFLEEHPLYDAQDTSFDESMDLFKGCFPEGFAWELLDLHGEPPVVSYTWRHWARYTGPYRDNLPTGETLEFQGCAIATVDDQLRITNVEMFFEMSPMLAKLNHAKCPMFK